MDVGGLIKMFGYMVLMLFVGVVGMCVYVIDVMSCMFMGLLMGGGLMVCLMFYNGSVWFVE